MKKNNYLLLFLPLFLFLTSTTFGQGIGQYTDQISKLGGELSNQEVVGIIEKLYQQKVINKEGRNQFKAFAEKRTLPEIIQKKDGVSTFGQADKLKMAAPLLFGKDSTKLNRNVILVILGFMDLANMDDKISKSGKVKGEGLSPILGEKWNFKPIVEGDSDNPLSMKINMEKYRVNYAGLLDGINNSGLIDAKVYADAQKWLDKKDLFILKDFSLLMYAAVRNIYYDSYEMLKSSQSKAIDSLALAGIIKSSEIAGLKQGFTDFKLLSRTDIFKKNQTNFSLNANDFDFQNKEVVLKKLFEKIAVLMPELKVSNLKFETIEAENKYLSNPLMQSALSQIRSFIESKKVVVKANFNGKNYVKEIDFIQLNDDMIPDSSMKSTISKVLNSAWLGKKDVQIFNDFLMDAGSKKRVYVVGDEFSVFPKSNSTQKVVFLMDSVQNATAAKQMPMLRLSLGKAQDFEGINSLGNLKAVYQNLLSTKLIEPSTDQKVENALLASRKKQDNAEVKKEIIFNLLNDKPNAFVEGGFFKKEGMKPGFAKFINTMALASKGSFKPEAIHSNIEEELESKVETDTYNFTFGFNVDGIEHSDTIVLEPAAEEEKNMNRSFGINRFSKVENAILNLVKNASKERKPYQFKNEGIHYMFLTEEEFTTVNEKVDYVFGEIEDESAVAVVDSASADEYQSSYNFDPDQFMNELTELDMIDAEGVAQVKAKFTDALPDYKYGFFPYFKNGVQFEVLPNLKQSNEVYFKNLYETIRKKFLPELKLENFMVKADSIKYGDDDNAYFEYLERVSYSINGQKYYDEFQNFEVNKQNILSQIEAGASEDSVYLNDLIIPSSLFNNYLADSENAKRVISLMYGKNIYFQFLDDNQLSKMDTYLFGDATNKSVKAEIEKMIELQLVDKVAPNKIEDLVNKYRTTEIYVNSSLLLDFLKSDKVQNFQIQNDDSKIVWHESLAKVSKNTVMIQNYKDNYAEISDKIKLENQKENNEDKVEKFELKSSLLFNKVKFENKIDLTRESNYYLEPYFINENYLKKINAELEKQKNPNRILIDGFKIYFLNTAQKEYLTEKGIEFIE
jgi:hypothetical protein